MDNWITSGKPKKEVEWFNCPTLASAFRVSDARPRLDRDSFGLTGFDNGSNCYQLNPQPFCAPANYEIVDSDSFSGCTVYRLDCRPLVDRNSSDLHGFSNVSNWHQIYNPQVVGVLPGDFKTSDYYPLLNCKFYELDDLYSLSNLQLSQNPHKLGQQLEELQFAYQRSLEISEGFLEPEGLIEPAGPCNWQPYELYGVVGTNGPFPFLTELQVEPQQQSQLGPRRIFVASLLALFKKRLARRIHNKIQEAKKLLFKAAATFCGISWQNRVWCLLHGSHPPKPELGLPTDLTFGCA